MNHIKMYRRLSRFNKSSKKQKSPIPYTVFNPHSDGPICIIPDSGHITIVTIDPGIKNCAIRCATYDPKTNMSVTNLLIKINFTSKELAKKSEVGADTNHYSSIFNLFEPYEIFFITAQYIAIESQYIDNLDLIRFGQHLTTYLMTIVRNKGNRPIIIELDSRLKTQMLGAPPKMNKPQRKVWAVKAAKEYLIQSNEPHLVTFLEEQRSKADDFGDVICYEKVVILLLFKGVGQLPQPCTLKR